MRTEVLERALYRIAQAAVQATDFASFFAEMHELIGGLMPARNFCIALYDEAEQLLTFPYLSDELGETPRRARAGKSLAGFVFLTGEPLLASPEILADLERRGDVDLLGAAPQGWLGVPLKTTGKAFGVLAVQTHEEGLRYGERERDDLVYVSGHIAAAIERKRADQRLRESEERFRLLVEGVKDYAIFGLDTEGHVATWNSGAEWINGYTGAEILGRHFSCFYPAKDIEAGKPCGALAAAAMAGQAEDEGWRVRKDGTRYYASVLVTALRDDQGRLKGFSEVTRDISERRKIEEALHSSERRLRTIFEAEPECVKVLAGDGTLLDMNPAGLAMIEADRLEDVLGRSVLPILAEEHRDAFAELIRSAASDHPGTLTFEIVGLKGTRRWLETHAVPMPAEAEGERRVLGMTRDVTERRRTEQALRDAETMSALGSLVAGLAHEVRNPLFALSSVLDAFEVRFGRKGEYARYLALLRGQIERLNDLMKDLLEYGKPARHEPAPGAIEDVIAQAVAVCFPLARKTRVKVESRVPRGLAPVLMDRSRLVQVFQNLLDNAIRHSPSEGTVVVEVRETREGLAVSLDCAVLDSGPGFREEDLSQILEPFFTRRRGGTGLGLSIVRRIVKEHGGTIVASNRAEGGAALTIRLPGADRAGVLPSL